MNWNAQHINSLFWKMALHDDEAAFKTLFVQFFAPLCVFALRYVFDRDVCKDIELI
jgi:RNA polymerase sigma-70 factor (ECF subfamily)